jgi:Snf7
MIVVLNSCNFLKLFFKCADFGCFLVLRCTVTGKRNIFSKIRSTGTYLSFAGYLVHTYRNSYTMALLKTRWKHLLVGLIVGQMDAVKIMAKDLVRTRRSVKKFMLMRANIQAVSLKIQTLKSQNAMAQAMKVIQVKYTRYRTVPVLIAEQITAKLTFTGTGTRIFTIIITKVLSMLYTGNENNK